MLAYPVGRLPASLVDRLRSGPVPAGAGRRAHHQPSAEQ
jgi:hypothetical protein